MAVTFNTLPVYSMLGDGRLVQTNTYTEDGSDKYGNNAVTFIRSF